MVHADELHLATRAKQKLDYYNRKFPVTVFTINPVILSPSQWESLQHFSSPTSTCTSRSQLIKAERHAEIQIVIVRSHTQNRKNTHKESSKFISLKRLRQPLSRHKSNIGDQAEPFDVLHRYELRWSKGRTLQINWPQGRVCSQRSYDKQINNARRKL